MGIFNYRVAMADMPKEILNWRLYWSVAVFGILGASRGLDEGLVGGMVNMASFKTQFHLDKGSKSHIENQVSNITFMVQLGSIGGSLLAFILCDKIGGVRSLQALTLLWAIGFVIAITSQNSIPQVLGGRFLAGLGIGMTTAVGPTYLVEVAPKAIRGMLTNIFAGAVYLGVMIAYFANWGSSIHMSNSSRAQWIPQSVRIMFAGLIFALSWTVPETPRWLIMKGRHEQALANLCRLRQLSEDHPMIQTEVIDVNEQLERENESTHVMVPANRYRFMLGIMSQLLGQWSGASSITIYAVEFFAALGKTGQSEKLFATCILGIVKFCSAYISVVPSAAQSSTMSLSAKHAGVDAIAAIYLSGFGWAMGWNCFQYLVNAEVYPLRLRALGSSIVMCFHFVNQYGIITINMLLVSYLLHNEYEYMMGIVLLARIWCMHVSPDN
ncbi:hypothetical protein V1523DRAFT_458027 [Lipomyces doorenjongii]